MPGSGARAVALRPRTGERRTGYSEHPTPSTATSSERTTTRYAPPTVPRAPTTRVLYGVVRAHLTEFVASVEARDGVGTRMVASSGEASRRSGSGGTGGSERPATPTSADLSERGRERTSEAPGAAPIAWTCGGPGSMCPAPPGAARRRPRDVHRPRRCRHRCSALRRAHAAISPDDDSAYTARRASGVFTAKSHVSSGEIASGRT